MLTFDELFAFVQKNGSVDVTQDVNSTPKAIKVPASGVIAICKALYNDPTTYFDMLSCVTGIDNGVEAATLDIVYNLYSIPFNHHLTLRVTIPRDKPEIDSVISVWRTADWHERELFDMYGIIVKGHPDLRRILMPADWEGYPLRKDYKHQAYYRDIKVEY
jgi:NADH-quinone oxidoreductase subunit C